MICEIVLCDWMYFIELNFFFDLCVGNMFFLEFVKVYLGVYGGLC